MSTAYPQVVNWLTIALVGWTIIAPLAVLFYSRWLFKRDFPGVTTINTLRGEVADLSGAQADLAERFSRFQNKEGMRLARETKEREKSVLEQAQEIAAGAQVEQGNDKTSLYRRRRSLNG